jgi:hypothetical protein
MGKPSVQFPAGSEATAAGPYTPPAYLKHLTSNLDSLWTPTGVGPRTCCSPRHRVPFCNLMS